MDPYLIITITILFSAFFSGTEIAFVSANKLKIELDKKKGKLSARIVANLGKTPSRFIGALLLGNNIALVIYGIAMARIMEAGIKNILPPGLESEFSILLIQTILSTLLILITAEFLPKIIFRINPNRILQIISPLLSIIYYLLFPFMLLFIGLSEFILKRILNIPIQNDSYKFSSVDFDDYIREISGEAQEENDIQQEIQMFQNVIDFRNIKVRECMVPRTEIIALDENDGIQKLKEIFVTTGYSRILIFRENIDNIISYVHAHDIFKGPDTIAQIAKQLLIVPEAMLASDAMSIFIHEHKSIALVVDEFGGTSGIVTMEDILEEILGEIEDEYDNDEFLEKQVSQNEYLLSGRLEIDYINEKYKLNIPVSDEYETLAGYILHHHESIPVLEEKILITPYVFYIQQASENRIEKVRLKVNLEE